MYPGIKTSLNLFLYKTTNNSAIKLSIIKEDRRFLFLNSWQIFLSNNCAFRSVILSGCSPIISFCEKPFIQLAVNSIFKHFVNGALKVLRCSTLLDEILYLLFYNHYSYCYNIPNTPLPR